MKDISSTKYRSQCLWGMWASLVIGVMYLGIGVLLPLDPAEKYRGQEYLIQLAAHPVIPRLWRYMFVIVAFLTILWISTADTVLRKKSSEAEGLYRWVRILGYGAAVVSAIQWYKEIYMFRFMTNYTYDSTTSMYRDLLSIIGTGIDPDYVWMFGALGLWYFAVSALAQKNGVFGTAGNAFGILSGVALLVTMIFAMTDTMIYFPNGQQMAVMQITALLGGVFGAVYHILMFFDIKKIMKEMIAI